MIGIIGAGISGLSAAYHLQKAGVDYIVLESSDHAGGFINTKTPDNYILDCGPNSILCDEEIMSFLKELDLEEDMLFANETGKSRYILKNGKYRKLPDNPFALLNSSFFSWSTKIKILIEPFKPSAPEKDETLAHFFERRFSKEVVDYALNPFLSGIYAGDPEELLVQETFPMLAEYENKYGSVLKGIIKNAGARKTSLNFKKGMQSLTDKLAKQINNIHYNQRIRNIVRDGKGFKIETEGNGIGDTLQFTQLIIATPSYIAGSLLQNISAKHANSFSKINYAPMSLVHTVFNKKDITSELNGFGGLNPKIENQFSAGCLWTSSVFNNRVPEDKVLFTSFVGGRQYMEQATQDQELIKQEIAKELSRHFGIKGSPVFQQTCYWEKALPQYDKILSEARKNAIELEKENIFICSNWFQGVSLSDCIKNGKKSAEKISNNIGSSIKHDYI
jgi:protoporphyrinogen/coproporphyrinogen III oxidase